MSFARILTSGAMALAVTLGLLLLMHFLIQTNLRGPEEVPSYSVPDILMPEREITTEYDTSKPEKPEEPQETPPDIPEPKIDTPKASNEGMALSPGVESNPDIGGISLIGGEGEMIPLTLVAPEYPRRAAQRGIEGHCEVLFTVTAQGTTTDLRIGDCPESIFERSALRAAEKLKYKPRVVNGEPVDSPGQGYRFVYRMAKD